jgi:hypothetical protein
MFIETRNDLDEYMDRLSERLYEIAAPSLTPEQFRTVWETLRLVGDVTTDLFNRLQKERDSALAAEAARERCANAPRVSLADMLMAEPLPDGTILDRDPVHLSSWHVLKDGRYLGVIGKFKDEYYIAPKLDDYDVKVERCDDGEPRFFATLYDALKEMKRIIREETSDGGDS